MICQTRRKRRSRLTNVQRPFRVEGLEPRRLLSSGIESEISGISAPLVSAVIEPISNINLSQTDEWFAVSDPTEEAQLNDPTTPVLVLDFNYGSPLSMWDILGGDIQISQGGVPINMNFGLPLTELTDNNNGELIVPLIEQTTDFTAWEPIPFSPATYQLTLVGGSGLAFDVNTTSPFDNVNIANITVLGQGASFATIPAANVLGTLGPNTQTISDQTLDPADPSSAVQLYKFTLATGHYWRVGAAIEAASIGSQLNTDLTLFDSEGNVLATSVSGTGLGSDPADPYLFAGLAPGTYYIGVSDAGDLPYSASNASGYNPVTGAPGYLGASPTPGVFPFDLSLVANPADRPTTVTGFTLNSVNGAESGVTGFTVNFSGPISASQVFTTDAQQSALEVVDSSGRVWPTTAINYAVDGSRLTMIFDQPLAPGAYSLIVPAQGGLTDLAGIPVASGSSGSDVLAHWDVQPSKSVNRLEGPDDLGVLWPLKAEVTWPSHLAGLVGTTDLAAGKSFSYQFDIIVPAIYHLEVLLPAGAVQVMIAGQNGSVIYDHLNPYAINDAYFAIAPGAYTLTFTNVRSEPVSVSWFVKTSRLDYESITANGIGQGNALAFWLTPSTGSLSSGSLSEVGAGAASGGAGSGFGAAAAAGAASTNGGQGPLLSASDTEAATSVLLPASPIPSSLLVTFDTDVVGLPSGSSMNVAAVGPMVEVGLAAVADRTNGVIPGIRYTSSSETEPPATVASDSTEPVLANATAKKATTEKVTGLASRDPEAASLSADRRALARAEWLVRLAAELGDQVGLRRVEPKATAKPEMHPGISAESPALAQVSTDSRKQSDEREASGNSGRLDPGLPVGIAVIAAVSYQMRRPLRKWWRARHDVPAADLTTGLPLGQGPHHRRIGGASRPRYGSASFSPTFKRI